MSDSSETYPDQCPFCGLILLSGHIFDAADQQAEYGPILRLNETARCG